jgi:serine/threonine protein kinase
MLAPGQAAGPYTVLSIIGAGGMGTVYLARDERLGRQIALKILKATTAGDAEQNRRRLVREAQAASSLNHPNICHIYDVGDADGQPWIAMEYVEGRTLQAIIPRDGLPPRTVARMGAQLADALAHAHERGLMHRDLKSANVVCDRESRPKILDFGLAAPLPRVLDPSARCSIVRPRCSSRSSRRTANGFSSLATPIMPWRS